MYYWTILLRRHLLGYALSSLSRPEKERDLTHGWITRDAATNAELKIASIQNFPKQKGHSTWLRATITPSLFNIRVFYIDSKNNALVISTVSVLRDIVARIKTTVWHLLYVPPTLLHIRVTLLSLSLPFSPSFHRFIQNKIRASFPVFHVRGLVAKET